MFVPLRYIGEPGLRSHFVPLGRRAAMLRETRIVNRPVHIEGRRVWVNPGLAPGFIASRTHVTLHAYNVRPRVFGATAGVQGAVAVHAQDLRTKGAIRRVAPVTVQRTNTVIQATTSPVAPKPLGKGEHGQLGSHPPRAAQGTVTPQPQQPQGPIGAPPRTGVPVIQHPGGPATVIAPAAPVQVQPQKKLEEPRVVNPPMGGARAPAGGPPPQPQVVHPAAPPPPPAVHAPPPPVVHAPPPPVVHAPPPPVVHAPPPPAMRAPPPAAGHAPPPAAGRAPPPKPGEKQPEPPK